MSEEMIELPPLEALKISHQMGVGSGAPETGVVVKIPIDYSDAALPMWPVWLAVSLLAVFCCICIARIFGVRALTPSDTTQEGK